MNRCTNQRFGLLIGCDSQQTSQLNRTGLGHLDENSTALVFIRVLIHYWKTNPIKS